MLPGRVYVSELLAGVYAAEEDDRVGDVCGRDSRRDSTDDRVDGGDGKVGYRGVAAVCDFVRVAVPALSRYFLDVPRGLCSSRNPDAAGGGQGREADVPADCSLRRCLGGGQFIAGDYGLCRSAVLFRGVGYVHGAG